MTARRRSIVGRDRPASPFAASLLRLCDATFAVAAALVDAEGETVDYAGFLDPFDIKVAAAEWAIVLSILKTSRVREWARTDELVVRGDRKSFFARVLEDGYAIVLELPRHALGVSRRGLSEAVRELSAEAGMAVPASIRREKERWARVQVQGTARDPRRPEALWIAGSWSSLEVLGRWTADLGPREIGFRARLPTGAEVTLVREPLGRWYVDLGR